MQCPNITRQAKEVFAMLQAEGAVIPRGCNPEFRKYGLQFSVAGLADGTAFTTAAIDNGTGADFMRLTTDGNHSEVLLDIVINDFVTRDDNAAQTIFSDAGKVALGDIAYNGQRYPQVIGGDSLRVNRPQGAFLGIQARQAGLSSLNRSCYQPFTQLNELDIALANYSPNETLISVMLVTAVVR